jgi:hypothetical protein
MMKRYLPRVLTTLLLTLLCTGVRAQTTQLLQSFEGIASDNLSFSPTPASYTDDGDTWAAVSSLPGITAATDGTLFWGGVNLKNPNNNPDGNPSILDFDAGTICNLTSAAFVFDYNVVGFNGTDELGYTLYLDGFPEPNQIVWEGMTGGNSTGNWRTTTVSIPGMATTARLEIYVILDGPQAVGIDNVRLTATGTNGSCTPVCGINVTDVSYVCQALTAGADALTAVVTYTGAEIGAVVSASGGSISGDDPATQDGGEITVSGLTEGTTYTLSISGGDCSITETLAPAADQCAEGLVLINEFQASPSNQEFVEVVSISPDPLDVGDYTIEDATGNAMGFPNITLNEGEGLVLLLGGQAAPNSGCYFATVNSIGLNDSGDDIIIRNGSGRVVAQLTYTANQVVNGESQARIPDRNPAGVFALHSTASTTGATRSPCFENEDNSIALPVELITFTATALAKNVALAWTTANEVDNSHFDVQRNHNGRQWETIGQMAASGFRSTSASYVFTDEQPMDGVSLYRLRQVDLDGRTTIFDPVSVTFSSGQFFAFPNPAAACLNVSVPGADAVLSLIGADGRELRRLAAGTDRVDVSMLRPGMYLLRLEAVSGTQLIRFVKK